MEHNQNFDSDSPERPEGPQGRPPARSGVSREEIASADALAEHNDSAQNKYSFMPVPRLKDRSNGWKPHIQQAFIAALAETGSVAAACRRVGRTDHGAYSLRRHPEAESFRAAWDAALDLGVRRIEDGAMDRALYGTEETVVQNGATVITRRRYNERLVMFLLRNRAPDRFAEGSARGLSAMDKMQLKRLKQQWRAEWDAERRAAEPPIEEVRQEILRKVEAMQRADRARWTPLEHQLHTALQGAHADRRAREDEESRARNRALNPNRQGWAELDKPDDSGDEDAGDEE